MSRDNSVRNKGWGSYFPGASQRDRDTLNPYQKEYCFESARKMDLWNKGWTRAQSEHEQEVASIETEKEEYMSSRFISELVERVEYIEEFVKTLEEKICENT